MVLLAILSKCQLRIIIADACIQISYESAEGIDNEANSFNRWMVEHMDIFLEDFFDEYNSKPYQEYVVEPIITLAALTNSAEVRNASLKSIEQIMATIAVQSNELRRFSPFRRQPG